MRTFHLLTQEVTTALPSTTLTIHSYRSDRRRPRFGDVIVIERLQRLLRRGAVFGRQAAQPRPAFRAAYSYGKNTATSPTPPQRRETSRDRHSSCWLCDHNSDHKGWSLFDTTQLLSFTPTATPSSPARTTAGRALPPAGGSGTTILQSSAPTTAPGDAPGLGNVDG
jgi:hypothetical protein